MRPREEGDGMRPGSLIVASLALLFLLLVSAFGASQGSALQTLDETPTPVPPTPTFTPTPVTPTFTPTPVPTPVTPTPTNTPTATPTLVPAATTLDEDSDGDGLSDRAEFNGWIITVNGKEVKVSSDPYHRDTDGDGLSDKEEKEGGTNPKAADTDGDGLKDGDEVKGEVTIKAGSKWLTVIFQTDPTKEDSDGDGITDFDEGENLKSSLSGALQEWDARTGSRNPLSALGFFINDKHFFIRAPILFSLLVFFGVLGAAIATVVPTVLAPPLPTASQAPGRDNARKIQDPQRQIEHLTRQVSIKDKTNAALIEENSALIEKNSELYLYYKKAKEQEEKLPQLRTEYTRLSSEVASQGERQGELLVKWLASLPPPEQSYEGLQDRIDLLTDVKEKVLPALNYEEQQQRYQRLLDSLKETFLDTSALEKVMRGAGITELVGAVSVLQVISNQLGEEGADPALKSRVDDIRQQVAKFGDWRLRLVPNQLLDLCDQLLTSKVLPMEMSLRKKMVTTVLDAIQGTYLAP